MDLSQLRRWVTSCSMAAVTMVIITLVTVTLVTAALVSFGLAAISCQLLGIGSDYAVLY